MNQELKSIIGQIRTIANEKGIEAISLEMLHKNTFISRDLLDKFFPTDEILAEKILEDERSKFEEIFVVHDFEGYNDAIDILFTVINEMARKFFHLSPSVTYKYKELFPEVYQKHIDERINFIYGKIQINLQKGISLGFYRDDISIELVARLYIRRLIDLHDTDNFPPEKFSMDTMFNQMFESFVHSVATEKGIAYFEKKKKSANLKT